MVVNRSAPPGPVVPVLDYQDIEKAIDWLAGAFGFTERLRTPPEPDGCVHHAQIAIGEGAAILAAGHSMFVPVADLEAHYARAKQFGAKILSPPDTKPFGERQYSAEDPAGRKWTFSQSVADVSPEDWGARVSQITPRLALLPRPRFCYLEIPAVDVHESAAFYEKVFGWVIRHWDTERPSFDDATGNISGAWVTGRKASGEASLLPYVWVDSIEATLAQVTVHGGEVVEAGRPDRSGGSCFIAKFRDPAGNIMGLYQE
jgi:predicted enzyme related to lactoylglutathione lyase